MKETILPMSTTLPQLQRQLRRAGFTLVRSHGSHHTYQSNATGARITVAYHGRATRFSPGTLRQIEAEMKRATAATATAAAAAAAPRLAEQIAAGVAYQRARQMYPLAAIHQRRTSAA